MTDRWRNSGAEGIEAMDQFDRPPASGEPTPTTEPRTAAGRALVEGDRQAMLTPAAVQSLVLAIEAEARQQDTPALRRSEVRRVITDAYYDCRNEGETMETAADRAADAVIALAALPPSAPAGLDPEKLAKSWWVAIQARSGAKSIESRRRWDRESDADTEHMRSIYRSVAEAAAAEYARLTEGAEPR